MRAEESKMAFNTSIKIEEFSKSILEFQARLKICSINIFWLSKNQDTSDLLFEKTQDDRYEMKILLK